MRSDVEVEIAKRNRKCRDCRSTIPIGKKCLSFNVDDARYGTKRKSLCKVCAKRNLDKKISDLFTLKTNLEFL